MGFMAETSSSMPASTPSSPSTVTSWAWAYSTTFLVGEHYLRKDGASRQSSPTKSPSRCSIWPARRCRRGQVQGDGDNCAPFRQLPGVLHRALRQKLGSRVLWDWRTDAQPLETCRIHHGLSTSLQAWDNRLHLFEVVEIVGRHGIDARAVAFSGQHLPGIHQPEFPMNSIKAKLDKMAKSFIRHPNLVCLMERWLISSIIFTCSCWISIRCCH